MPRLRRLSLLARALLARALLARALVPRALVALVALCAARGVGGQGRPQLAPELRALLLRDMDPEALRVNPAMSDTARRGVSRFVALSAGPGGTVMIDVFVRAPRGAEAALITVGALPGARAGDWVTARIPLDRLDALAQLPGIQAVELARRAKLDTDSSMREIGLTSAVRQRVSGDLFQGATGRGVIIGFVDSGIDFTHPDFIDDDLGRSRVIDIWDQTLTGSGPGVVNGTRFGYGLSCTRSTLGANGTCPSHDVIGHGTHVAGIAAGDGSGARRATTPFAYVGVAPAAELIMVRSSLSTAAIIDGIAFVFARAAELGRPAVVNLSLGADFGPHDGSDVMALMIDSLSGPGRIVVSSAGNTGNNNNTIQPLNSLPHLHAEVAPVVGDSGEIDLVIPLYTPIGGTGNDLVLAQAYYALTDDYTVTVIRPSGTSVTATRNSSFSLSTAAGGGILAYNGSIRGDSILGPSLQLASFNPASQWNTIELFLGEWITGGAAPAAGTWRFIFKRVAGSGGGRVDAYIPDVSLNTDVSYTLGATNRFLVGSPGGARRAITVAGYSTRFAWQAIDGNFYQSSFNVPSGDLLAYSSPGPARDGFPKPDISAPARVFSTLTKFALWPQGLIASDSSHLMMEGTSMAAPHVTGVVALLLAERPLMTPEEVRSILTSTARKDANTAVSRAFGDVITGGTGPFAWGAGKLAAAAALGAATVNTFGKGYAFGKPSTDTVTRSSARGVILPLQSFRLAASDPESLSVVKIGVNVTGDDAAFRLGVVVDANRDGQVSANETVTALSAPVVLAGSAPIDLIVPAGAITVPRGGSVDLIVVGQLSGSTPNSSAFTAAIKNERSQTKGLRTGTSFAFSGDSSSGAQVRTSVLGADTTYALSANPVRAGPLIINLAESAKRIEFFDFAGRRVRRIIPATNDRVVRWALDTDDAKPVANGVYVMVMELASGIVRQKIFVLR